MDHELELLRSQRAALARWNVAVAVWHREGCPRALRTQSEAAKYALGQFAKELRRVYCGMDLIVGPAGVAEGL